MPPKNHVFHLFRYQILPITRVIQHDFYDGIRSIEDLLSKKNDFFWEALMHAKRFESKSDVTHQRLFFEGDVALYRFAANRSLNRETKDFKQEEIDNWPSVYAVVWNDPEQQIIAIERRTTAFQQSETVVAMITKAVNAQLAKQNLRVHWEPLFEKSTFWSLIKNNEHKIKEISFELVTPNMANISGALTDDLKNFAKNTNTATTTLKIESDPASSLTIKDDNPTVNSLVDYSSQGGGDIKISIHGYRKKVSTSSTIKEIEVSNVEMSGDPEDITRTIKQILSQ